MQRDIRADVCIVGAGMAGLSAAYQLAREGQSVVVLERARVGSGETQFTTAHLSNAIDDRFHFIQRIHGREFARLAAESHAAAISEIESICVRESISCNFRRLSGYLFPAESQSDGRLEQEFEAAREAGVTVRWRSDPLPFSNFKQVRSLEFPNQARIEPTRYLNGLAQACRRLGVAMYGSSPVVKCSGGNQTAWAETEGGPTVLARWLIVATNTPIHTLLAVHNKQVAYQTYAISAELADDSFPDALFWDDGDPYHYIRLAEQDGKRVIVLGGEDHRTGDAGDGDQHARLEDWLRQHVPQAGPVVFRWSGEVMESVDGLGYIGKDPGIHSNVFMVTGDSGMGMTHGAIAGMLLRDFVLARANPWIPVYDPSRMRLAATPGLVKDNLRTASEYVDWIVPAGDETDLERGEGRIVQRGPLKVAMCRDRSGCLHEVSAICTHLQGIVRWNPTEETWDCPCHGSRFFPDGTVFHGPATTPLRPARSSEEILEATRPFTR